MSGFNRVAFRREVAPQLKNKAFPLISRRVEGFFEREKERMIAEFEKEPITKELDGAAPKKSAFLDQGNLHGLFGYEDVSDEIQKIRETLESSEIVFLDRGRVAADGSYTVRVKAEVPSVGLLNELTPLPWQEQKGLVDAVELGVSGFFRTLFGKNFENSISGEAIQVKNKVRDQSFSGLGRGAYLRGILKRFTDKLRKGPRASR